MRVKFLRTVTADFVDHQDCGREVAIEAGQREPYDVDKTFYRDQIVECDHLEENVRGFMDILWANGDVAVGLNKQSITVIEE